MSKYMHLLNGKPAFFTKGAIYYAKAGLSLDELLVDDLKTIRKHEHDSNLLRHINGLESHAERYSYLRVCLPEST